MDVIRTIELRTGKRGRNVSKGFPTGLYFGLKILGIINIARVLILSGYPHEVAYRQPRMASVGLANMRTLFAAVASGRKIFAFKLSAQGGKAFVSSVPVWHGPLVSLQPELKLWPRSCLVSPFMKKASALSLAVIAKELRFGPQKVQRWSFVGYWRVPCC